MKKQPQVKFRNKRDHKAGVACYSSTSTTKAGVATTRKDLGVSGLKMKDEKFRVPYTTTHERAHTVDHERVQAKSEGFNSS